MSNFLNSFNNGFLFGMLSSSPIFGCFGNYWNRFTPFMPSFSLFGNFGWNNYSAAMPSFMSIGVNSSMYTPPNISVDFSKISYNPFASNGISGNTSIWNNTSYTQMPATTQVWNSYNYTNPWNVTTSYSSSQSQSSESRKQDENISYDANELKSKWSKKKSGLSNAFYNKVISVAKKINCDPNALMALMYSESGLDPAEVNPNGGATGLIQFMPETAKTFGTTTETLKKMSAEQQLNYVEKYFLYFKSKVGFKESDFIDAGTLYALTFLPKYSKRETLCSTGSIEYRKNKGLDTNKDGKITRTELSNRLKQYMA